MKYEVIMFDADDTLFDFKKAEKEAFKNTMVIYGINYDENYHYKIYDEINTALWRDFDNGLITQEELKYQRFKELSHRLGAGFDEYEFAEIYMKNLSQGSFLYEDSIPLVEGLKNDYRMTIITNGLTDVQHNRVRNSAIGKYMEEVIISEEVGLSKPDFRIFDYALKKINYHDKSKVIMVGDSLTTDIQGGINSGIDTCWYNPDKNVNKSKFKPTYEISQLMMLKKILEG
ncbi:YjjG family noncanonical pyrimidine nucleotidase [Sedimentibacter sp. B4]|uniref:YjjG family noncanonical pyrimidine nucleotidase n=1 Tax=Sedimentibacter sp. B4 TaxID=304766 RepID=UPI0002D58578|nr:YjjG family noncanonical pyrimidine nucleotidase [Sedimentibacter sp. B4]